MPDIPRGRGTRRGVAPRGRGRRTAAERDQHLAEERERTRAREEEYEKARNADKAAVGRAEKQKKQRSQEIRRRGRGGFMGERHAAIPSGPFSAGSVISPHLTRTFTRPWAPSKRGRTGGAQSFGGKIKREVGRQAGSSQQQADSQIEPDATQAHDELLKSDTDSSEGGERIDVDYINLISSDDENEQRIRYNSPGFAPVRINRVEHVDRALQINPEGSGIYIKKQDGEDEINLHAIPASAKRQGKQRSKDLEIVRTERRWRGVYLDDDEDDDDNDNDVISVKNEPSAQGHSSTGAIKGQREAPADRQTRIKTKRRRVFNTEPTSFATDEDREEWARWQSDRSIMVAELGGRVGQLQVSAENDKMESDSQPDRNHDHKENHPFLLQLPPVLADLIDINKTAKTEQKAPTKSAQGVSTEASSSSAIDHSGPTGSEEQRDEEIIAIKEDPEPKESIFPERPKHLPKLESGYVGKLRVYKSGKTELDWGGISLEMKKGITPKFLQDIVMIRMKASDNNPSGQAPSPSAVEGEALSFGQVRGKFIITPDFDEIFR